MLIVDKVQSLGEYRRHHSESTDENAENAEDAENTEESSY
jgi:hypothetical protein